MLIVDIHQKPNKYRVGEFHPIDDPLTNYTGEFWLSISCLAQALEPSVPKAMATRW